MTNNKFIYTYISFLLILISFVVDNEFLRSIFWIFFGVQMYFSIKVSNDFENKVIYFFSPSFLALLYINLNAVIGGYSLYNRLVIDIYQDRVSSFFKINDLNISVSFMLLCSWVVIMIYQQPIFKIQRNDEKTLIKDKWSLIILCFLLIIVFSVVKIELSFLGGNGSFSKIPKTITSIILFYELSKNKTKYRAVIYFITFCVFVLTNFESKREVFFLVITILFIESFYGNINILKFNFKKTLITILIISFSLFSILIMTIARGFGQYEMNSSIDSIKYIPDLINDFDIVSLLFTTSEAPTTTYHSLKAIAFINNNPNLLEYGSTYNKLFYVPFPKSIIGVKPYSMTSLFTMKEAPTFYRFGGSLPVNIYAEAYWNFHYFGFLFIGIILFFLNQIYFIICRSLALLNTNFNLFGSLFVFTYLIGYYRGFGFDLYFVNCSLGFGFAFFIQKIVYKFYNTNNK